MTVRLDLFSRCACPNIGGFVAITINTNISASVAQAAMTRNSRELDSAMEKLSIGKKINSAADNASGLAITSRMTTQIRGLGVAIQNASDAIGMVKDLVLTGDYAITWPTGTKIISGTYDGSVANLIQVTKTATGQYWLSISKEAV